MLATVLTMSNKTLPSRTLPPNIKLAIRRIFVKHFVNDKPCFLPCLDILLKDRKFLDIRQWLATRITHTWFAIYELYGWKQEVINRNVTDIRGSNVARKNNFRKEKDRIMVEAHNSFKSASPDAKCFQFNSLTKFKYNNYNWEVVYGAVNDIDERNYVTNSGIRVLTGDAFLKFMLGDDWDLIVDMLKELLDQQIPIIMEMN